MSIYLRLAGKAEGPFTTADVQSRLDQGQITLQTAAWRVGWLEWKTVADVLQSPAKNDAPPTGQAPPPQLAEIDPVPPSYKSTLILASVLFLWDGLFAGQGGLAGFVLILGTPILAVRAILALKKRRLFRRRLASIGIYVAASIAVVALVKIDQKGAMQRAGGLIAACEAHKKATGEYPKALVDLVPQYLPAIPPARKLGVSGQHIFQYLTTGQTGAKFETNSHVLVYVVTPPFGKRYYVFEEGKWGFYD